jgi:hypothetical protein
MGTFFVIYCQLHGYGTDHNPRKAFKKWQILPIQTFNLAYYLLAEFYIEGSLFGKSLSKAFKFYDHITKEAKLESSSCNSHINNILQHMLKPTLQQLKEMKIHQDDSIAVVHKDIKPKHLIIATHPLHDFSIPRVKPERDDFWYISSIYQRNPTKVFLCWRLAKFYFEGV